MISITQTNFGRVLRFIVLRLQKGFFSLRISFLNLSIWYFQIKAPSKFDSYIMEI